MLEDAVGAWLVRSAEREEMTQNLKVEICNFRSFIT